MTYREDCYETNNSILRSFQVMYGKNATFLAPQIEAGFI